MYFFVHLKNMKKFLLLSVIALCGTCTSSSNVESPNRIAGGFPVTDHNEFPYVISLQQRSLIITPTRGHRCGGALVSLRHAVTAATCLYDLNGLHTLLNPNDYVVFAGAIDLTNVTSDHHRDVERFTVHPGYITGNPYFNDIAVITLTTPFLPTTVRVVNLAPNDNEPLLRTCTSAGWGSSNDTSVPNTQLLRIQKFAMPLNEVCQPFYNLVPQIDLQSTQICATTIASYTSCEGDLGNPLVCSGNLQGILVRQAYSNCALFPTVSRPEIYTRITSFRTWISTTAGASTFQPAMAVLAVIASVQIIINNH